MAAPAHPSTASVAWPSSRRFVSSGSAAPRGAAAGAPPIWLDLAPTSRCADGGACTPQHCECSMAFLTPLRLEWIGVRAGRDRWRLRAPLRYRTESGEVYTVPDGYETDGESRPPLTMPLSGPPCTRSGVLHDWLGDRVGVPGAPNPAGAKSCSTGSILRAPPWISTSRWRTSSPRPRRAGWPSRCCSTARGAGIRSASRPRRPGRGAGHASCRRARSAGAPWSRTFRRGRAGIMPDVSWRRAGGARGAGAPGPARVWIWRGGVVVTWVVLALLLLLWLRAG